MVRSKAVRTRISMARRMADKDSQTAGLTGVLNVLELPIPSDLPMSTTAVTLEGSSVSSAFRLLQSKSSR